MENRNTRFSFSRSLAVAMVAAALLVGSLTAAYATDLGGIRRSIQIWLYGGQKAATVEFYTQDAGEGTGIESAGEDGGETAGQPAYAVTWTDENGEEHRMEGGGVAIEFGGRERPLTMDEYIEHLESSQAMVEVDEDGRVTLYWYDHAVDITDRFEDGVCRLPLTHGDETLYFSVLDEGNGAYNVSAGCDGYVD